MSEPYRPSTIHHDMAEGSPESSHNCEVDSSSRTGLMPVVRLSGSHGTPTTETGVLEAVVLSGEGKDNTDDQDARRTTAEANPVPTTTETNQRVEQPSILIIEDSTELAEIIVATLERLDMVTAHETHGNKAFRRYDEIRPDVLLLDIGLPDMTGWELLENVREQAGPGRMPKVIVITAYGDPANRLIGKLQNVHDYLIKPFTSDEVERVVLSALGKAVQ